MTCILSWSFALKYSVFIAKRAYQLELPQVSLNLFLQTFQLSLLVFHNKLCVLHEILTQASSFLVRNFLAPISILEALTRTYSLNQGIRSHLLSSFSIIDEFPICNTPIFLISIYARRYTTYNHMLSSGDVSVFEFVFIDQILQFVLAGNLLRTVQLQKQIIFMVR